MSAAGDRPPPLFSIRYSASPSPYSYTFPLSPPTSPLPFRGSTQSAYRPILTPSCLLLTPSTFPTLTTTCPMLTPYPPHAQLLLALILNPTRAMLNALLSLPHFASPSPSPTELSAHSPV